MTPASPAPPPGSLRLRDGEVHVWRAMLASSPGDLLELRGILSPDERARADRFHAADDRANFVAARGALRRILARYTGERPEDLRFSYAAWGKPRLEPAEGARRIEFSVSHSDELAVYALAEGRRLGVDVERIVPVLENDERLSRSWLSEEELAELSLLDACARTRRFYWLWTRKEAYLKARGEGFSLPPDRVRISGDSVDSPFESAFEPGAARRWTLRELETGPDYVAALAVEGHDWRLSEWDYR
jgi:4'-phosphopantetheinyl transferase